MVFIAGGGNFGARALKVAKEANVPSLVADISYSCHAREHVNGLGYDVVNEAMKAINEQSSRLVIMDAKEALWKLMEAGLMPFIIVPAVPNHFAADVVRSIMEKKGVNVKGVDRQEFLHVVKRLPKSVICSIDFDRSRVVTSYMPKDELCKVPCNEPIICPKTKKVRLTPMYEMLQRAFSGICDGLVLQSHFLGEDVGGFYGKDFARALKVAMSCQGTLAIGTACRCHGVLDLLSLLQTGTCEV